MRTVDSVKEVWMNGDAYWVWQSKGPGTSGWSTIAGMVPGMRDPAPMFSRDETLIRRLEPVARQHARVLGHDVRLARFEVAEVLDSSDGPRGGQS